MIEFTENEKIFLKALKFPMEYQELVKGYAGLEDLMRQLVLLNKKEISAVVKEYFDEQDGIKTKIKARLGDIDRLIKEYGDNASKAAEYLKKVGL